MMDNARPSIILFAALCTVMVTAIGGAFGANALAAHWLAATRLTVVVPQPGLVGKDGQTRQAQVAAVLRGTKGIASLQALSEGELADLLRPWLGSGGDNVSLPLPAVFAVHPATPPADLAALARQLADIAPGIIVEAPAQWHKPVLVAAERIRLTGLAIALAMAVLVIWVIAISATGQRSAAGALLHALGAADRLILARIRPGGFGRALFAGGVGSVAAMGLLVGLEGLIAPLAGSQVWPDLSAPWQELLRPTRPGIADWPILLWAAVVGVPVIAASIYWLVARMSVRRWLRRLP